MIELYGFGSQFGVVDASPFVVKVDLLLRVANLEYAFKGDFSHIKKSPKQKLPFIVDEGEKVGDSHIIFQHLAKKYQFDLDKNLSEEQRSQSFLATKAIDESLYWLLVYSRWVNLDTWPVIKEGFFGKMPAPLKWFLPGIIQKDVIKTMHRQGYGRHSKNELLALANEHFSALSALLKEKPYFFGDEISSFDIAAYAMLCQFISVDYFSDFNQCARKYINLVEFCTRIEHSYYEK